MNNALNGPTKHGSASRLAWFLAALALATGCSSKFYKKSSDDSSYRIISQKQESVAGQSTPFTIEPPESNLRSHLDAAGEGLPRGGPDAEMPDHTAPKLLGLADAMRLARYSSRDYQFQKEELYLSSLDLVLARHEWTPLFTSLVQGDHVWDDDERRVEGSASLSMTKKLATGADLALSYTLGTLWVAGRGMKPELTSSLDASIVQPLLKGAGRAVAEENLRQAERDVIYQVRDFIRFRRSFTIDIVSAYLNVLQSADQTENEWRNYQNLIVNRQRSEFLEEAGRLPRFEVDQARQAELRAHNSWVLSKETYEARLDSFRIQMGLPPDAPVKLDRRVLEWLIANPPQPPEELQLADAVQTAIDNRLDLMTSRDQLGDSERKLVVARNGLLPRLDLVAKADVSGTPPRNWSRTKWHDGTYSVGFDLDPGLDRVQEAATYRTAIINLERSKRRLQQKEDNVRLEVREAVRRLERAKQSYTIQRMSVDLARRRVESVTMLLDAGRASMRDLLESQEDFVSAQNALTAALIRQTVAWLEYRQATESLELDEEGRIPDVTPR